MKDSLAKWICGPTGSRRCDERSGEALVGKLVGLRRHPEAVTGRERHAEVVTRQRVLRLATIGVDVDARVPLAGELVARDLARRVECEAGAVDRGGAFGVPPGSLLAHALQPHRPPDQLSQYGSVHGTVVGVVAAVRAGAGGPNHAHFL